MATGTLGLAQWAARAPGAALATGLSPTDRERERERVARASVSLARLALRRWLEAEAGACDPSPTEGPVSGTCPVIELDQTLERGAACSF
jgi:hypothetical protein